MRLLEPYKEKVLGAMRGFDRVRFRGTLRWLASERGIQSFVRTSGILLKDFGRWVQEKTRRVRESCERQAGALGIETIYLRGSAVNKEDAARQAQRPVQRTLRRRHRRRPDPRDPPERRWRRVRPGGQERQAPPRPEPLERARSSVAHFPGQGRERPERLSQQGPSRLLRSGQARSL